ncbi:MAG: dTDP-4-dehydrorhamnose reductase [Phycisphaerales bacterium]|nr:dTDP-4-dehydrorhamnose reductase [Phycisphaerales bacterium]
MNAWRQGRIAILGADGMLGRQWQLWFGASDSPSPREGAGGGLKGNEQHRNAPAASRVHCFTYPAIDFERDDTLQRVLDNDPRIVINCAAYTNVDQAESEPDKADRINAAAVGTLARLCRERGVTLVHYSTDYVFDGQGTAPYAVDAPTNPANIYGRSKLRGEQLLQSSGCDHLLIRTSWLYAPWAKNFVRTIAAASKAKPELHVVHDQRGRPTSTASLVDITARLLDRGLRGTFHATDDGECTWFDFATAIAAFANPACRVRPCTTAEFPRPAPRPAYSVLDLSKTIAAIGPLRSWREALQDVLPNLDPL